MRDLDALLARVDELLNLPELPPLTPWVVSTTPVDRPVDTVRRLLVDGRLMDRLAADPVLNGRWDEVAERPRPRPPRPFPVGESAALARRAEQKQPKPSSWWGRWRHRG